MAGATREKCGARVRAPWSRKADTSVYMRVMPPGPQARFADWAEEASQVSALDKGPEKRRKGPQPKHQLGVSVQGKHFTSSPWQHSMAGTGRTPLLPKE